jgi:LysR family transcriptional regulator for bpeEF and oprC
MDQLTCMRVFARVVERGSFVRAAESLDMAKPTATLAVARLEKRLGVRLLHRTTRRLNLTDEGRAFYQSCLRILDELAETEDALSGARVAPRGRLRASVPNSFVHQQFFPALPRFLARHPELEVELVITDRAVNLVEEGIDCAVRAVDIPDDSTLIARRIAPVRRVTCASPEYLQAHGTPRCIADLAQHNCIRFISPSTSRTVEWRFERDGEAAGFAPRGNLGVTSLEGAVAAAVAGIGIAQVSDVLALPELRSGLLQALLVEWAPRAPDVVVVYPSQRYLTAKVKAFSDFVAELLPAEGWWARSPRTPPSPPAPTARKLPRTARAR